MTGNPDEEVCAAAKDLTKRPNIARILIVRLTLMDNRAKTDTLDTE